MEQLIQTEYISAMVQHGSNIPLLLWMNVCKDVFHETCQNAFVILYAGTFFTVCMNKNECEVL